MLLGVNFDGLSLLLSSLPFLSPALSPLWPPTDEQRPSQRFENVASSLTRGAPSPFARHFRSLAQPGLASGQSSRPAKTKGGNTERTRPASPANFPRRSRNPDRQMRRQKRSSNKHSHSAPDRTTPKRSCRSTWLTCSHARNCARSNRRCGARPPIWARTARADHVAEQWDDSNWALLRGCPVAKTPAKKATKGT